MFEILEKFVKKLEKLENYHVLRQEPEFIIIGTKVIIKEHKEVHSTFSTYTSNLDKELPVFFILVLDKNLPEVKEYRKKDIPIIILSKPISNSKVDIIKKHLDDFIKIKF